MDTGFLTTFTWFIQFCKRVSVPIVYTFLVTVSFQATAQVKEWDKSYNGNIVSVHQTNDGGYVLGGNSGVDFWIAKTDAAGEIEWEKTFGGDGVESLKSMQQTSDGGYILGGFSVSNASGSKSEDSRGGADYWVVKVNAAGEKEWDKTFGGRRYDFLFDLVQTSDGGYILGGWSYSGAGGDKTENNFGANCVKVGDEVFCDTEDYWVVKIDAAGKKQWDKTYGGNAGDFLWTIRQTNDGGYILGGFSFSPISGNKTVANEGTCDDIEPCTPGGTCDDFVACPPDGWIVKLDASGVKEWDKTLGGALDDMIYAIEQTNDGGYIVGGNKLILEGGQSENVQGVFTNVYWVTKLNAVGQIEWERTIGGSGWDYLTAIQQTALDGGYIVGGWSSSPVSGDKTEPNRGGEGCDDVLSCRDYWVVKLDPTGHTEWDKTLGGNGDEMLHDLEQTSDGGYILGGISTSGNSGDKTSSQRFVGWLVKLQAPAACTPPDVAITLKPASGEYTGGDASHLYLGYGPQSVRLKASGADSYTWSPATGLSSTTVANPVFRPTAAGTYTFTVTGASGACTGTTSVTITVTDVRCGNKNDKVMVCHNGQSLCLSASAVQAHLRNHSQDRLGACSTGAVAKAKAKAKAKGPGATIQAYPNPFSSKTIIAFTFAHKAEYTMQILDLNGSLVQQWPKAKAEANDEVRVEWEPKKSKKGIYILRLVTQKGVQNFRLMRE